MGIKLFNASESGKVQKDLFWIAFFCPTKHSKGFSVFSQIPCDSRLFLSILIKNHIKAIFAKYV